MITDYKLSILNSGLVYMQAWIPNVQSVVAKAQSYGWKIGYGVYPFGYSDALMQTVGDNNLAEALFVKGSIFTIQVK